MKIMVSHSGKQYVNALLEALTQKDLLLKHFTAVVPSKLKFLFPILPKSLLSSLDKYHLRSIPKEKTIHFPLLFLLIKLLKTYSFTTILDRFFDHIVSLHLNYFKYDLIIGYENCNLETFRKAKRKGKITVLDLAQIHHHNIVQILEPFFPKPVLDHELKMVNPYKEAAFLYTDYVFTLSSFATDSLVANHFDRHKIFEVNLGIDNQLFKQKDSYSKVGVVKFLFVGTVMRRKGISLLLKVWKELQLPNAELSIVGPLSDGKDILSDYEDVVTYFPFLPHAELVKKYQGADVFVFPSFLDSWAQTVVEAMACGTPVIISENTGAKDAVKQGGGFIIPVNDAEALKEKILYFYENRSEIERIGREAHLVAQQYTWENYHKQVLAALEEIAKREGIPFDHSTV